MFQPMSRPTADRESGAVHAVDLSTHPGHLARRLQQAHHLLWNAMVSQEITSPQFAVLNSLTAEPGLDQRTVGERVGLDRSTVAEVITRLLRRELLDKVRDPNDGRRFLLRLTEDGVFVQWLQAYEVDRDVKPGNVILTEDGVRTHRRLALLTVRMNQVFLGPLSADEQQTLFGLMGRVADAAEAFRVPEEARSPGGR